MEEKSAKKGKKYNIMIFDKMCPPFKTVITLFVAPDVLHGIEWSSNLNEIFISNFREDDSLSWQYFGSSTGFMRQFPGKFQILSYRTKKNQLTT